MASEALRVPMIGRFCATLLNTWRNMMRGVRTPTTRAASTYGSVLTDSVALRMTRKYWGTKITVMEIAADRMPPTAPLEPPDSTMETTIASSRDGKA